MKIIETYVDASQNALLGDSGAYEPFTEDTGRLFRDLQQTHGRCTGRMYVDLKDGGSMPVGWVFQKRVKYDDSDGTWLREVWVHLFDEYEKRTVINCVHHNLDA